MEKLGLQCWSLTALEFYYLHSRPFTYYIDNVKTPYLKGGKGFSWFLPRIFKRGEIHEASHYCTVFEEDKNQRELNASRTPLSCLFCMMSSIQLSLRVLGRNRTKSVVTRWSNIDLLSTYGWMDRSEYFTWTWHVKNALCSRYWIWSYDIHFKEW